MRGELLIRANTPHFKATGVIIHVVLCVFATAPDGIAEIVIDQINIIPGDDDDSGITGDARGGDEYSYEMEISDYARFFSF